MLIALVFCIPLTALISVFATLKAVQLGLKWKVQVENKEEPTLRTPIIETIKEKQEERIHEAVVKEQNQTLKEWLGVDEE